MERHWLLATCIVALLSSAHTLFMSQQKALWFDELFTWNQATQAHWAAYRDGWAIDGNPPLGSALGWVCLHLFGPNAFALRLPSLLGMFGAAALFACYVRRRTDGTTTLLAVALLCEQPPLQQYAIEARPYGLVLFFTALALLCWSYAEDARRRPLALTGLTVAIAGGILSHHLALVSIGMPLLIGEIVRSLKRRRLDWPLLLCVLLGLQMLWFTAPLALETRRLLQTQHLPSPTFSAYAAILWHTCRNLLTKSNVLSLTAGAVLALLASRLWPQPRPAAHWKSEDIAAMLGSLVCILPALVIMQGQLFGIRYGIGCTLGFALLLTSASRRFSTAGQLVFAAVVFAGLLLTPSGLTRPVYGQPIALAQSVRTITDFERCFRALPAGPVVIANGFFYPMLYHYADAAQQPRLIYLVGTRDPREFTTELFENTLRVQRESLHMDIQSYTPFLQQNREFLALDLGNAFADTVTLEADFHRDGLTQTPIHIPECDTLPARLNLVRAAPQRP